MVDAGPLIALQDRGDPYHARCAAVLSQIRPPWITTLAVVTEAMYLLGERGGWMSQELLWQVLIEQSVEVASLDESVLPRLRTMMNTYRDVPMDFADASLVAVAEDRGLRRIFTVDGHFHAYRLHGQEAFEVIPGPLR